MPDTIYLDHAATTPVAPEVLEAMLPFFSQKYGNPSSLYATAREARLAMEESRAIISGILGVRPEEIIFTSGGTESDNLIIKGIAWANQNKGNHIITSQIEHHAVLHACQYLEKKGFKVTYLPVDPNGVVQLEALQAAIDDSTILVTIMAANNEVGTLQPLADIAAALKERSIPFHTDAVQAVGALPLELKHWGVDALSLSAHKFYGPKGIGALYVRKGIRFEPQQQGGAQEGRKRAGTENVASIVGMAKALEIAYRELHIRNAHLLKLRDKLISGITGNIPRSRLTGHPSQRLPNSASFVFDYIEGESILLHLDFEGIAASSGSACTSASLEPSHVLRAMNIPVEIAHGSLRLTLGHNNTEAEVDKVLEVLPPIIEKLRAMSPLTHKTV